MAEKDKENTDTKKCKSCKTDIPDKAKKCPNCQTDLRNWFVKHPIITVILAGIVLLVVFAGSGGNSSETEKAQDTAIETTTTEEKAEDIEVNAADFVKEFDENQLAAETKYEDRWVKFTGYISNISEDIVGEYYVVANPVSEEYYLGTSIQCFFDNKDDLLDLKNGQEVTLRGKVDTQMMNVLFKNCEVVN